MFPRHCPGHIQALCIKNFYCISSIHVEKIIYILQIVSLIWPSYAAILFVACLITNSLLCKVRKFLEITWIHCFSSILLKKNIKSCPPASFSEKKCLRNILLIFGALRWIPGFGNPLHLILLSPVI